MSKEFVVDTYKMQGIDWINAVEDDEKIIHCKDHTFVRGEFEMNGKKLLNIYTCQECGFNVLFDVPKPRPDQYLRGRVYPFTSLETLNKFLEAGHRDSSTYCEFLCCDEMITKDILE